jgi:Zinc finger, C3HC4 type (RING finger)
MLGEDGELTLPKDERVDVEAEMRKRLLDNGQTNEQELDSNLYNWWLNGGWFGGDDNSGDFKPSTEQDDEDTTSVISMSTDVTDQEWESEDTNDDGRRTPTQRSPQASREATPIFDNPLRSTDLAELLHPKTPEQRAEAQAMAAHLTSETILTRSRYQDLQQRERSKILTSSRHRPSGLPSGSLSIEEEAEVLEHLIISRRAFHAATASTTAQPSSWAEGASGLGEGGPQCVVCQSAPRSIIVWPCRCLSLCDDCRVSLAMKNFETCTCCRSRVSSFSRIFVP